MSNLPLFFFTFSFLTIAANGLDQSFIDDFMEKLQEFGGLCAEEVHATTGDIADLVSQKLPPSTHEGKCMIYCIQKRFNLMHEDGSLNQLGAMRTLSPLQDEYPEMYKKVLKLFIVCGMQVTIQEDPCETATLLAICGQEKAEEMGLGDFMI